MGIERDRHGEKGDKQVDRIRYKIQAWGAGKDQGLGHADEMIGYREQTGSFQACAQEPNFIMRTKYNLFL